MLESFTFTDDKFIKVNTCLQMRNCCHRKPGCSRILSQNMRPGSVCRSLALVTCFTYTDYKKLLFYKWCYMYMDRSYCTLRLEASKIVQVEPETSVTRDPRTGDSKAR